MKNFKAFLALSLLCSFGPTTIVSAAVPSIEPQAPNKKSAAEKADEIYRKSLEITQPKQDPLRQYERAMEPIHNMAIQEAATAIKKDPSDAKAYAKRAAAYSAKKDFKSALPDYDKTLELDPKQGPLYAKRAIAHFFMKDYDKSWKDVNKAKTLGADVTPVFLDALKKNSKREK